MTVSSLLQRAAAASNRREALVLVLEAWRAQPVPELAALVCALDLGEETSAHRDTEAFCEAAATRTIAERGSLAWSAGLENARLEALRHWSPDPRLSAVLEENLWEPPPSPDDDWWTLGRELRPLQRDPMLELSNELRASLITPSAQEFTTRYSRLAQLAPEAAAHAQAVARAHFAVSGELTAIFEKPGDDGPRLVYADTLLEHGDPRGLFIIEQCQRPFLERRLPRQWLGRLAAVVRGSSFGFRRGFLASATVRFKSSADVVLFGSLPEWRTLEQLSWAWQGAAPWARFVGPTMSNLVIANGPSFNGLLATVPWMRLESVLLELESPIQLATLHDPVLFPRLQSVTVDCRGVDVSWFNKLRLTQWKYLELNVWPQQMQSLMTALEDSSLETLAFTEVELRRGKDGRFSSLLLRHAARRVWDPPSLQRLSQTLPLGFFESIDAPNDLQFRIALEPHLR